MGLTGDIAGRPGFLLRQACHCCPLTNTAVVTRGEDLYCVQAYKVSLYCFLLAGFLDAEIPCPHVYCIMPVRQFLSILQCIRSIVGDFLARLQYCDCQQRHGQWTSQA